MTKPITFGSGRMSTQFSREVNEPQRCADCKIPEEAVVGGLNTFKDGVVVKVCHECLGQRKAEVLRRQLHEKDRHR